MLRLKNGIYTSRYNEKHIIEITDNVQPVYIERISKDKLKPGLLAVTISIGQVQLIIHENDITEREFKAHWTTERKKRLPPCNLERELIPYNASYNFSVPSYCIQNKCPLLQNDIGEITYSCTYRKCKKIDYEKAVKYFK